MAIRNPRLNIKKLTPDTYNTVYQEIRNYIYNSNECRRLPVNTVGWLEALKRRQANHAIIVALSGLSDHRLQDLIAGRTTMATYWLPDGSVRKDY